MAADSDIFIDLNPKPKDEQIIFECICKLPIYAKLDLNTKLSINQIFPVDIEVTNISDWAADIQIYMSMKTKNPCNLSCSKKVRRQI